MSELSIFNFQNNIIRTIIIDGEVWFVAVDVCAVLDIRLFPGNSVPVKISILYN